MYASPPDSPALHCVLCYSGLILQHSKFQVCCIVQVVAARTSLKVLPYHTIAPRQHIVAHSS